MDTKITRVTTLLFIYVVTIFATCKKNCTENIYSFDMKLKAYPNLDSVNINDTIWVEIDEGTTLFDKISNTQKNFSGAGNLGTAIGFQEIIGTVPQIKNVANDFNYKLINGVLLNNPYTELIREYQFIEINSRYLFKLGIIPKRQGIFRFIIGDAANVYSKTNNCSKASFSFNFVNTNQHYYLNPNFPGGPVPPGGDYYFKVK
jgi:hypothetical protein